VKYAWIREQADSFPIALMCRVLDVSSSGYYDWRDRPPSPRAQRHERIQESVKQVYNQSHRIYGSVKVAKALKEDPEQETACRNTVVRCMRELGLKSRVSRSFKPTTTQADPSTTPAPNRLDQDFTAAAPDRKWVTDITYLPTEQGWVYLAVVLDLFSRKVVAGR
jgi:putative transposase